ncbi:hypothetical protein LCGC14_0429860 [marine sediment metagenome]|uniref:Uncharacterized protein n=1 Tax=marine sediment metagenome TaxID=412755 RepID=A0A0F9SNG6_9ZZZZ
MNVQLQWKRETKGAHFYVEVNSDGEELNHSNGAAIQNMYIRKTVMTDPANPPQTLKFDLNI